MENIKIQSTAYPDVQLTQEQWAKELKIGIRCNISKQTDKSNHMMNLYDERTMCNYIKKRNFG